MRLGSFLRRAPAGAPWRRRQWRRCVSPSSPCSRSTSRTRPALTSLRPVRRRGPPVASQDEASAAVVFAAAALVMGSRGRIEDAVRDVKVSTRMVETFRDLAPWYEAEARITLARALLQLDDAAHARAHLADAGAYMSRVEDAPVLTRWLEDALELTDLVACTVAVDGRRVAGAASAAYAPELQRDCRPVKCLNQYCEVACEGDLSQARRLLTQRGGRNRAGCRSHPRAGTPDLIDRQLASKGRSSQGPARRGSACG